MGDQTNTDDNLQRPQRSFQGDWDDLAGFHVCVCYTLVCNEALVTVLCKGCFSHGLAVLALDLEGVHDVKLHHPSSSVATSN